MRIVVFGAPARVGIWEGDKVVDVHRALVEKLRSDGTGDPEQEAVTRLGTGLLGFVEQGAAALDAAEEVLEYVAGGGAGADLSVPAGDVKLGAPWPGRRVACAGGNYGDHLAGMTGGSIDQARQVRARGGGQWGFWKVLAEASGPGDDVPYPRRTEYLDYEGEVAIVIGKRGKDIPAERFEEYVWGVTLVNDLSIRDGGPADGRGMSYNLPKNFDGSFVVGPAIVAGEQFDPSKVDAQTRVNGELRQSFNSSDMIFSFAEIVEFLSQDFTLVPGDVISGGTAKGTAADQTPKPESGERSKALFLKAGDVVEVSSPQIGTLTTRIV